MYTNITYVYVCMYIYIYMYTHDIIVHYPHKETVLFLYKLTK